LSNPGGVWPYDQAALAALNMHPALQIILHTHSGQQPIRSPDAAFGLKDNRFFAPSSI
jgi:hypothetical protein